MGAPYEFVDAFNDRMRHVFDSRAEKVSYPEIVPGMEARDAAAALLEMDGLMSETNDFIDSWPAVMRDAVITLVTSAIREGTRVRMAWMPGYDFEVTIAKANSGGAGEVTLLLRSKYPDEVRLAAAPER